MPYFSAPKTSKCFSVLKKCLMKNDSKFSNLEDSQLPFELHKIFELLSIIFLKPIIKIFIACYQSQIYIQVNIKTVTEKNPRIF